MTTSGKMSMGGPIQTGHVRKTAMLASANTAIARIDGRSFQATSASQDQTANDSATTWAKNESCVNEPTTCADGTKRKSTAVSASGVFATPPSTRRRATRNTRPTLTATEQATTG